MTDPRFLHITNPFGLTDVRDFAAPTFADIDGDGDLDAVVGNGDGNTKFYPNTGTAINPVFAAPDTNPFGLTNVGGDASPTFADIDGDGDLDAVVGNYDGNTLFYRNTGTATNPVFAAPKTNPFGLTNVGYLAAPTFADIDGDGDLDAFVGSWYDNTKFYRNIGTATNPVFAAPDTNPFGLTDMDGHTKPTFADIDGDGDLDAFVGNYFGNTKFYRNTGTATNPVFAVPDTNPFGLTDVGHHAAPTFADIDGDGDLDAVVGNGDGNTLVFLANRAPVVSKSLTAVATEDDLPLSVNLLANATDLDKGDTLSVTNVTFTGDNAGITLTGNTLNIKPSAYNSLGAGESTKIIYNYQVSDGNGRQSDTTTATITINGVNDAPIVANVIENQTVTENQSLKFTFAASTFLDVDASNSLTYSATLDNGNPLPAWLKFNPTTRTFSGTPGDLDVKTISIKVSATDNSNASVSATFNLSVTPLNFTGTPGVDNLTGTRSNNIIDGGAGNDTITGGAGQDKFIFHAGDGIDTITDFGGYGTGVYPNSAVLAQLDTLQFIGTGLSAKNLLLTQNGNNLEVTFDNVANTKVILQNFPQEKFANGPSGNSVVGNIQFDGQTNVTKSIDVFDNNDNPVSIFNQNTVTFLNDLNNNLKGFDNSADVINGQGGNDRIDALSGNDYLRGGAGDDILLGGTGNDSLWGGLDNDTVYGEFGNDILYGESGNDLLDGDAYYAVTGSAKDTLYGGSGNDTLYGGEDDDKLYGESGNDILYGESGKNILSGGDGADVFFLGDFSASLNTITSFDTITDFSDGTDKIGLINLSFGQLTISSSGGDTLIKYGSDTLATLTGINSNLITSADFVTI